MYFPQTVVSKVITIFMNYFITRTLHLLLPVISVIQMYVYVCMCVCIQSIHTD